MTDREKKPTEKEMAKRIDDRISDMPESIQSRLKGLSQKGLDYPKAILKEKEGGSPQMELNYEGDQDLGYLALKSIFGTNSLEFAADQIQAIYPALTNAKAGNLSNQSKMNAAFAALAGISPNDSIESLLAAQMVVTHNAAMDALATLKQVEYLKQSNSAANIASKFMNLYIRQMEALNKHRGKGQQKMTVEHVHVNEGGQAIIGTVEGGGGKTKKGGQPHALRSKD
ncbi:MAG: hypothetical protein V7727_03285 [Sneathiella sp.]